MISIAIDRGNTSTKAALLTDGIISATVTDHDPQKAVDSVIKIAHAPIDAIIYSTVGAGGDEAMEFLHGYAPKVISLSDDIPLPIKLRPDYRHTLGADRIAAIAGAVAMFPGRRMLVVDAGTAVTYEFVDSDGSLIGGNIAAGMRISLEALHDFTALLPLVPIPDVTDSEIFGTDTPSAILKGTIYAIVGAIEAYYSRLGDETEVIITGGNASLFAPLLRIPYTLNHHLVIDGLQSILSLNI